MTITLGTGSYICEPKHIHGGLGNIIIGKFCSIAANVTWDAGYQHFYKAATTFPMHTLKTGVQSNVWHEGDINVGSDVWIGMGATIMSGKTIANGAIIGANTTVRRNVLPYEIYTGSKTPEKYRFSSEIIAKLLEIAWWDWADERVIANAELLVDKDIENFINNHI